MQKLPCSFSLLFVFVCSVSASISFNASGDESLACDGVDERDLQEAIDDLRSRKTPPAARVPDPSQFHPFNIHFEFQDEQTWSRETYTAVLKHTDAVVDKFWKLMKGPVLRDARLKRKRKPNTNVCEPVSCGDRRVAGKWGMPCTINGNLVPESDVPAELTDDMINKVKSKHSMIVFVTVRQDLNDTTACPRSKTIASARVCQHDEYMRPTHGRLVFCNQPSIVNSPTSLRWIDTIMHEVLHIMTSNNLYGLFFPATIARVNANYTLQELLRASESRSWKDISRNWVTNLNGDAAPQTRSIVVTPKVQRFVADHFQCPNVEGAEVSITKNAAGNIKFDIGHWNMRLFPEEILAPISYEAMRFSNLTLSYLQDSGFYDVLNWTRADAMTYSRPKERGCDVAAKSCYQIQREIINEGSRKEIYGLGPYCYNDPGPNNIATFQCSPNGSTVLRCMAGNVESSQCRIRVPIRLRVPGDYNTALCRYADQQPSDLQGLGFKIGENTTCVTVVKLDVAGFTSVRRPTPFPACISFECRNDEMVFLLKYGSTQATWCIAVCKPGDFKKSFTMFIQYMQSQPCKVNAEFLCPEIYAACPYPRGRGLSHGRSCTNRKIGLVAVVLPGLISVMILFLN